MESTKKRIEEIKKNGYQLDFGIVFENAFENYKKIAVYAGAMLLIFSFIFIMLILGIAIAIFGIADVTEALKPENLNPEKFSGNFLLFYTGSVILISCLISPFQAGFLKMADSAEKGEEFRVSNIFEYYKSPYFEGIFISTLIITLTSTGLSTLFNMLGAESFGIMTSLTISLLTFLSVPLIVFGNLNAMESIQSSVVIVYKQPLIILGLLTISILGAFVGLIALCIGVFFTLPFVYSMKYAVYNSIIDTISESQN